MTPEAAREALTEQMARTMRFANGITGPDGEDGWDAPQLPERTRESWRRRARLVMAEVLSARLVDDCPRCEGTGVDPGPEPCGPPGSCRMPGCTRGKRYGPLLVTMATTGIADVMVPRRWVDDVVSALDSATVIGMRSCRDGDHLHYSNHDRLVREAAPWSAFVESSSLPTRLEAVSSPVKEDGTTTSDAVAKSRLPRRPGETQ